MIEWFWCILWFFMNFMIFCELLWISWIFVNFRIFVNFVIFVILVYFVILLNFVFLWILWFLGYWRHLAVFCGNIAAKIGLSLQLSYPPLKNDLVWSPKKLLGFTVVMKSVKWPFFSLCHLWDGSKEGLCLWACQSCCQHWDCLSLLFHILLVNSHIWQI